MGKILVIQTAFIGDVILATPLLRAIHQEFPDNELSMMVIPATKNLVENNPYINHLIVMDKHNTDKGVNGFKHFVELIKRDQYDLAVLPHRSHRSALLVTLAKIPIRVGFSRSTARLLYTHAVQYKNSRHEVLRNLDLLKPFGVENVGFIRPEIYPDQNDIAVIDEVFEKHTITLNEDVVVIAPGSIWFTKQWLLEYYGKLTRMFVDKHFRVCVIGGDVDKNMNSVFAEMKSSNVINLTGKLTLRQSTELLRRAKLLVSNDSAPTHLGSAANVPTITIFGSTAPEFGFGPLADKHRVLRRRLSCQPCTDHGRKSCPINTLACLKDILPEEVFRASIELMKQKESTLVSK